MNNAINFDEIKTKLVETGLAYQEHADAATERVIFVEGEHLRDESISVEKVSAGWRVADLCKVLPVKFDLSQIPTENEDAVKAFFESQFPGVTVILRIL